MPTIDIEEKTLINLATFTKQTGVNSMSEAINVLIDRNTIETAFLPVVQDNVKSSENNVIILNENDLRHRDLRFSKVIAAFINDVSISRQNWKTLLDEVMVRVKEKADFTSDGLQQVIAIPTKNYEYSDKGYYYFPKIGLSIQGQSATDARKEALRLCKQFDIRLKVEFTWSPAHEDSRYSGKKGIINS